MYELGIIFFSVMAGCFVGIAIGGAAKEREIRRYEKESGEIPAPIRRANARRAKREARAAVRSSNCGDYGVLEDEEISV